MHFFSRFSPGHAFFPLSRGAPPSISSVIVSHRAYTLADPELEERGHMASAGARDYNRCMWAMPLVRRSGQSSWLGEQTPLPWSWKHCSFWRDQWRSQ